MRGGVGVLLVGMTFARTVNAEAGSSGEMGPWRIGPGAGFGLNIAHYPGPGGELFVAVDKSLSDLVLFRAEAAGIYWRHPSHYETPYDLDRGVQLESQARLSRFGLQACALGGLKFSDAFAVYAGVVAGHARTSSSDTLCGDHSTNDFVYGVALQPALYLGDRGDVELSLNGDLARSPNVYCTEFTTARPKFHENTGNIGLWIALRARFRF